MKKASVFGTSQILLAQLLKIIIHDQYHGGTNSSENITQTTLKQPIWSFILENLAKTMKTSLVGSLLLPNIHLHSSSDRVNWIRHNTRTSSDTISNTEFANT